MADAAPAGLDDFINAPMQNVAASSGGAPAGLDEFIAPEMKEEKYGTLGQQAITGLEGAASAGTFGLSKGLERALGVKPEDIKAREEVNPITSGVGQVAGLVGSSLLVPGGGAAGIMEKAGAAVASNVESRIGAAAIKSGIEGAIFQGGNEVGKMVLSDPDQTVGTAAVNVGLAGFLGASIGYTIGGVQSLWASKFGPKIESSLAQAGESISGESSNISAPASTSDFKQITPGSASSDILDLSAQKPNIRDLQESASNLGIELTPGMQSESPFVQNVEGNLSRRASFSAIATQQKQQAVFDGLDKASKEMLRDATNKSEVQVGKEIQEDLTKHFSDRFKASSAEYNELKPVLKAIPIHDDFKLEAMESLNDNEFAKADPNGLGKFAESLGSRIENVDNLAELKIQRSLMGQELDEAMRSGSPKANVLKHARDLLTDMRTKALDIWEDPSLNTLAKIRTADANYSKLQKDLSAFSIESGTGGSNNVGKLLKNFSKVPYENFPNKVFNTNDVAGMQFFKDNFPKSFEAARRLKLADIAQKSISEAQGKNSQFQVGSFLRQLSDNKIGPEARSMLLDGKNLGKLQDIQNIYRAIPGNPNPSGTSYAQAFANLFSPSGLMQNLTDAAQYAFLKAQPHLINAAENAGNDEAAQLAALKFAATPGAKPDATSFNQMADYIRATIKGENLTSKSVKDLFKAGETILPSHLIPSDKEKEKLDKKLKDLQVNNEPMLKTGEQVGNYMPEHSGALSQTAMNAVNYVNSLRPSTSKSSPLDSELKVSKADEASFDRVLEIAQQPLVVLNHIKEGSLTAADVSHIKTLYPGLYKNISQKIYNQIIEASHKEEPIPYKSRLGLSLFLGEPLDSTMTQAGIMSHQIANAMPAKQPGQQMPGGGPHSMKNIGQIAKANQTPQQARLAQKAQA